MPVEQHKLCKRHESAGEISDGLAKKLGVCVLVPEEVSRDWRDDEVDKSFNLEAYDPPVSLTC